LILLLLGQTETNVLFNQQSGEFTSALAAKVIYSSHSRRAPSASAQSVP